MSRPGSTRIDASRSPVVVIVGEDSNDRDCIKALLATLCPQMQGRLVALNVAPTLRDATKPATLAQRLTILDRHVRAKLARHGAELGCLFVHEDFDNVYGSAYESTWERVQDGLTDHFEHAHYLLAAWEIEAWLMLFPKAIEQYADGRSVPSRYRGGDSGLLRDPKRIMMREVTGGRRPYTVSDAPKVFRSVVDRGLLDQPEGTNRSWASLLDESRECCRTHIPAQRPPAGAR